MRGGTVGTGIQKDIGRFQMDHLCHRITVIDRPAAKAASGQSRPAPLIQVERPNDRDR